MEVFFHEMKGDKIQAQYKNRFVKAVLKVSENHTFRVALIVGREVLQQILFHYLKCELNPFLGDKLYTGNRISLLQ